MKSWKLAAAGVMLLMGGCGSASKVVPNPEAITLQDALVGTVNAINAAYKEARKEGNKPLGYYPCTVTATYNISAVGVTTNKTSLSAEGGPASNLITLSASYTNEDTLTGSRGNSVQVVFTSSICAPGAGGDGQAKAAQAAVKANGARPKDISDKGPSVTPVSEAPGGSYPEQIFGVKPPAPTQ